MAKERKKVELKPVEEDARKVAGYVRLHGGTVEEVVEVVEAPAVRVGKGKTPPGAPTAATKEEMRMRTDDSDLGALVEVDGMSVHHEWDDSPASPRKTVPWGWLVLLGCVFLGALTWSLVEVNRSKEKQGFLVVDAKGFMEREAEDELAAEAEIGEIEHSVLAFLNCRSAVEMLRYVRHPLRVAPLMEKYYAGKPPEPIRLEGIRSLNPVTIDNRANFWIVSFEIEGGQVSQVVVEVISPTEVKVDWEIFTTCQPMDWDVFARSRPGDYTGDFRVYVETDNFYTYEFADSDAFSSFRLTALRGEESLYGYVARNSPLEAEILTAIAGNGGGSTPMILRLHLPEGLNSRRGVVVRELVCPRWLFVDNPDSEKP